jgi:[ribosomal protein S5]-alanine N-acetyltransferase
MIRLVPAEVNHLEAALAGDDALAAILGHRVVPGWVTFSEALEPARDAVASAGSDARWGTRLFITDHPQELVGWGGFKGPPNDGVVEIGYEIAQARQGRGLATAAARSMVAEAFADDSVTAVIAHTLAERNASNRVLDKAGFHLDDELEEDGQPIWRFRLDR